jgi:hypothetical protein
MFPASSLRRETFSFQSHWFVQTLLHLFILASCTAPTGGLSPCRRHTLQIWLLKLTLLFCGFWNSKKLSGIAGRPLFRFEWWKTIRIYIFGICRFREAKSYPLKFRHVM